jgi:hypothetical protein
MKTLFLLTFALAPAVLTAQSHQCDQVLKGTYVVTTTGTAGSPVWAPFTGPVATMGTYIFDGVGNFQVTKVTIATANPPANVTPPVVVTGTYALDRDCFGSMTLNFAPAPDGHYNMVASPDGRQITMISTDLGDVLIANATRLEHRN